MRGLKRGVTLLRPRGFPASLPSRTVDLLQTVAASCPYCGEPVELLVDLSAGAQSYVEDCQVCCRPMVVALIGGGDAPVAIVRSEDE